MNVRPVITNDYGKMKQCTFVKNKPKQTQFFTAENAEIAKQMGIFISGCPIKKYNLNLGSLRSLRARRLVLTKRMKRIKRILYYDFQKNDKQSS